MSNGSILVQTTFENNLEAEAMAALLQHKHGAIDKQIKPMRSFYYWDHQVKDVVEDILTICVSTDDYKAIEDTIARSHHYQLPCIIALPANPQQLYAASTDCIIAKTIFDNEDDANAAARNLVKLHLSAGAKVSIAYTDLYSGLDWPSRYLLCAETTETQFSAIEQFLPDRKWSLTPIIDGEERFMQWIRDCSQPRSFGSALQNILPYASTGDDSLTFVPS